MWVRATLVMREFMACVKKLREFGLVKGNQIVEKMTAYTREDARRKWELSRRQAQNWIIEEVDVGLEICA
jgi:hypothetical protein